MLVAKWSDNVEGYRENIDTQEENSLVPWSGTDPYAKMNCFTWSKENNDWISQKISTMNSSRTR